MIYGYDPYQVAVWGVLLPICLSPICLSAYRLSVIYHLSISQEHDRARVRTGLCGPDDSFLSAYAYGSSLCGAALSSALPLRIRGRPPDTIDCRGWAGGPARGEGARGQPQDLSVGGSAGSVRRCRSGWTSSSVLSSSNGDPGGG